MHRDVNRGDVHLDNSVYLCVGDVCKCDVVAKQEGKSRVVVFEIKCVAQTFWHLVDKAENTLVFARTLRVHKESFGFDTKVVVLALANGVFFYLAFCVFYHYF